MLLFSQIKPVSILKKLIIDYVGGWGNGTRGDGMIGTVTKAKFFTVYIFRIALTFKTFIYFVSPIQNLLIFLN